MRSLLWLLAVFAAAVALVILGRVDAGYVLFIYPPYRVEVSILFFAVALVAGFFLLYGVLRLLNARLSLLARDEAGYRQDIGTAQRWIERYFDPRSKHTAEALQQLKQLSAASLTFQVPSITESLEAVRGYKARRERAPG